MLFLPENLRGLETHPQLSVIGCELPPRNHMAKSQEGRANVETPEDFWKAIETGLHHLPTDLKESTSPPLTFQISVKPKQESPTCGLSGTKLDQMD
jgi:hypothetical protein